MNIFILQLFIFIGIKTHKAAYNRNILTIGCDLLSKLQVILKKHFLLPLQYPLFF